jgi:DNA-binding GntR family transcriptional regulator
VTERRFQVLKLNNFKPLREVVFETLREAIIKGVLKPGERLMEKQLAENMGVSRTPVREAIRKLELEGFVRVIPRKGTYVSEISFTDVREIYEIRASLEALACGLAAQRAAPEQIEEMKRYLAEEKDYLVIEDLSLTVKTDVGLHELIYQATSNERIMGIMNNLKKHLYRLRSTSLAYPGRKEKSLEEHQEIVQAIAKRDVELAQKLGKEHILRAQATMFALLSKGEFK